MGALPLFLIHARLKIMNRFFKTLLVWVLVLALPAQALGSAFKLSCGPMHQVGTSIKPSFLEPTDARHAARHEVTDHATHHHSMNDDADNDTFGEASTASSQYKSAYCSACATCCTGAAVMHSGLNWIPIYGNSFIAPISPASSFTGHIPARLERPPRSLRA